MKKYFLGMAAAIFSAMLLRAQETQFGLKAGLNVASLAVKSGADFDAKAGLHVGGLAHIHITRHFALQPEIVYSMQGGKIGEFEMDLNYVNIPVLAQYMHSNGFRLQTGPQLGILTGAESEFGDGEADRKDEFSDIDFSWVFGAGYLFPQGLGIDARYNLGINNIRDVNDYEARNSVFQVGLFYQFMNKGGRK